MMAYLSRCQGISIVVENIFEERFNHVAELSRMGATIHVNGRTAMVEGVPSLSGAPVCASDLRAGAALIVAGLMAKGKTLVHQIEYIDRGYEHIAQKLTALGADIVRGHD
jgi:UDP-N-acetylglucosamine 1-carboxyvinyltransferase